MNKPWLLIIDIFAGFLIIFIGLVLYFGLRRETVMKSMYEEITEEFISNVKRSGKITIDDYENTWKEWA